MSDLGNAQRLVAAHGQDLRYVPGLGWLHWTGAHWRRDDDGEATRRMANVTDGMLRAACDLSDDDDRKRAVRFALASQNARRIAAALELASQAVELVVHAEDLDRNPFLLTVANGTVDLRAGELRTPERADLITRVTDIEWHADAACPRWERFLAEVFAGDRDLIEWVQRLVGYCLTGDTSEHVLAVLHGRGCNGKSTLVNILRRLAGDLAVTASFDTFTRARGDRGPRNDLARLRGARLVTASESGEGRRLDEATVKEITGGDTIAARFLYGEHFEYRPAFKLLLVTNHRPRVDGDDDAIWRRLRLVPFDQSFEGREDPGLAAELEHELPGILRWAVDGCLTWQRDRLGQPPAVRDATAGYRADEDLIGAFLAERCLLDADARTPKRAIQATYTRWCEENGERALSAAELGARLARHGIRRGGKGRSSYVGIALARGAGVPAGDGESRNSSHARARGAKTETTGTPPAPGTPMKAAA
ncbi:MAG TPA: phage/plasmid primase, P4 family [Solirubrobacteraceae bacterium]|jgi:putative DNA primase/helicase